MKRTALTITLLLTSLSSAVTRPPVPTDMPFAWDPNLCSSPILEWIIVPPSTGVVYAVGYHNEGLHVDISVAGTGGEPIDVLVQSVGTVADPNGGWNHYFQIAWTPPPGEMLHYLQLLATDAIGRQASVTLLVYATTVDPGVFFPVRGPIPVSRMKDAQRMVQYAKKQQFPLPSSIQVR